MSPLDSAACIDFRYVSPLRLITITIHITDRLSRKRIRDIQAEVAPHAEGFFEHLYSSLMKNSSDYQLRLPIISDTLKLLERHGLRARLLEAELMQEAHWQGVENLLSQAQELTQRLRDMTKSAEELWCFTVEDTDACETHTTTQWGEIAISTTSHTQMISHVSCRSPVFV